MKQEPVPVVLVVLNCSYRCIGTKCNTVIDTMLSLIDIVWLRHEKGLVYGISILCLSFKETYKQNPYTHNRKNYAYQRCKSQ